MATQGATSCEPDPNDHVVGSDAARGVAALQGVTAGRLYVGCGLPFKPRRPGS